MNLRKLLTNQNTPNYAKKVFTGKVRFVHRGKIKTGIVTGKPYTHTDRKSTRLNSSHRSLSRMPSSA